MTGRRRCARPAVAVVLAVAAAVTGCAAPGRPAAPYGVGPAGEALSAPAGDVQQAYLAYWDDWLAANRPGGIPPEQLARHAGDPNLSILRAALADSAKEGHTHTGTVGHRIEGMVADGDLRRIYDCVDLNRWLITDAATGRPVDQAGARPPQLSVMTLRRIDGDWKVTDIQKPQDCARSAPQG
ncbi:hypothetical protein OG455_05910 [Kitasatospora sp. NBC_01287]|uniref:hypothetical protein n=1 Tax=Kitasatospora sp. NBC_01287 TaxID=2903573 RepID=UPI002251BE0A|nr:hypothetical protein [Kitasatospora sp. NBC_01287]MCX4745063.1 hypothetical protein [Kitasatospora sp. NBC_01287]